MAAQLTSVNLACTAIFQSWSIPQSCNGKEPSYDSVIVHYRVACSLLFKLRPSAKPFIRVGVFFHM